MQRASITALAVVLVASVFAVPVAAAPPASVYFEGRDLACSFEWEGLDVSLSADSYVAAATFSDGVAPEPIYVTEAIGYVQVDGSFTVDLPIIELETGAIVGTAGATVSFAPTGEPWRSESRFRDGNRWVELSEYGSALAVAGQLTVVFEGGDPVLLEAIACSGSEWSVEYWSTNPNVDVSKGASSELWCAFEQGGWQTFVWAQSDEEGATLNVASWEPDTEPWWDVQYFAGTADLPGLGEGPLDVAVPMFSIFGEYMGDTVVAGSLALGDSYKNLTRSMNAKARLFLQLMDVSGTVALPNDMAFDLAGCDAVERSEWVHIGNPRGPKPDKGMVPANDLPTGAVVVNRKANLQTGAAAYEPEVRCSYFEGRDEFPLPLARTVWYRFTGNGSPMRIDTAGSAFDTILGVYLDKGGAYGQLACVDDVIDPIFSLQAAVTIDTTRGQVYYVQVGGFDGEFGLLKLSVR